MVVSRMSLLTRVLRFCLGRQVGSVLWGTVTAQMLGVQCRSGVWEMTASGTVLGPEGSLPPPPPGSPRWATEDKQEGALQGRSRIPDHSQHPCRSPRSQVSHRAPGHAGLSPPPGSLAFSRLAEGGEGTTHPPQGHIALVLALGCEWGLKCSLTRGRVLGGGRLLRLWGPATCWLSVYQRFPPSSCFEGGP